MVLTEYGVNKPNTRQVLPWQDKSNSLGAMVPPTWKAWIQKPLGRIVVWGVMGVLILTLIILPLVNYLAIPRLRSWISTNVETRTPFTMEAGPLGVSLLEGLVINDLSLTHKDEGKNLTITIKRMGIRPSLARILGFGAKDGPMIEGLTMEGLSIRGNLKDLASLGGEQSQDELVEDPRTEISTPAMENKSETSPTLLWIQNQVDTVELYLRDIQGVLSHPSLPSQISLKGIRLDLVNQEGEEPRIMVLPKASLTWTKSRTLWKLQGDLGTTSPVLTGTAQGSLSQQGEALETLALEVRNADFVELNPILGNKDGIPQALGGSGDLSLELNLGRTQAGSRELMASFDTSVEGLSLLWPAMAEAPLDFAPLTFKGNIKIGPGITASMGSTLSLGSLSLTMDPRLESQAPEETGAPGPRISIPFTVPKQSLMTLLTSIPKALRVGFESMELAGTFSWSGNLTIPLDKPSMLVWSGEPELEGFSVQKFPRAFNVFGLNREAYFSAQDFAQGPVAWLWLRPYEVVDPLWLGPIAEQDPQRLERNRNYRLARGLQPKALEGPEPVKTRSTVPSASDTYVPLGSISPYLVKAVLASEDGNFFFHLGVDWSTVADAVVRNFTRGEVQVGASTISMQLVKNLFLDQSREFVRKIQEIFLVYLLEQHSAIPKERILELYLNIAEFGPGLAGVKAGAWYYFKKHPGELNLLESVWLATMLPSPKRYSGFIRDGAPASFWLPRMQFYLDLMAERGRITPEEFGGANPQTLTFPGRPQGEIQVPLEDGQAPLAPGSEGGNQGEVQEPSDGDGFNIVTNGAP